MRIKKMITKGELRPVLKQFLPTSTIRNALGQIRRICMLILGKKGLTSFVRSVRESLFLLFFRTDLAPSSLGLYEHLRQILSRTDLALG